MRKVKMTKENKIKTVQIDTNDPRNVILDSEEDRLVRRDSIIGGFTAGGKRRSKNRGCR